MWTMSDKKTLVSDLIRNHRKDEIACLKSQYDAVVSALVKAEEERDRFFAMKQTTAGLYADERAKRQKMEHELKKIHTISGNCVPEERDKNDYEASMDEIFQHCRNIFEPIED